ncbi:hypothetical protein T01_5684 [Trichinella spiralis]|uniref:Uncharacterized protein n=1 Tax=Trichinella spiralis TaxID=6334 RepID=A0A0V1B3S3_TRISP|nr:hypothetical protein T01_5684 [Trichinella spiralis]
MPMLYFIVDVCINNTFLLKRYQQSYQKTKRRFMREISAQLVKQHIEMRYQNQKSMHKLNMPSSVTDCSQIINVTRISYNTIKSITMLRARASKINVKPLLFIQLRGLRCKICSPDELNKNQSLTSFDTCMMFIDVQIVPNALIKYFSACALSRNCFRYLNDIMHALHSTSSNTERTPYDSSTEHFCRQCGHYCTECIVEILSEPSLMIASRTNGRFLIFLTSLNNVFYRIANEALINAGYFTFSNGYCNAFLF